MCQRPSITDKAATKQNIFIDLALFDDDDDDDEIDALGSALADMLNTTTTTSYAPEQAESSSSPHTPASGNSNSETDSSVDTNNEGDLERTKKMFEVSTGHDSMKNSVSFGNLSIRKYDMILGDHPDCTVGPPVSE
jgi:hypothetical protein